MNPLLSLLLLQIFSVIFVAPSTILEYPLIQYFGQNQGEQNTMHSYFQSNSKFAFGYTFQNVLNLSSPTTGSSSRLTLRCQAAYPVRWITRNYNGRVQQLGIGESTRMNRNPLQNQTGLIFYQDLWISTGGRGSQNEIKPEGRILQCESFSNSSLTSAIFINRLGFSTSVEFSGSAEDVYLFILDANLARKQGSFLVPCSAKNIPTRVSDVKLIETDKHNLGTGLLSDNCVDCICYAMNGNCQVSPCDSCGDISLYYWQDAQMNNPNKSPYDECVKDSVCIRQTIKGYMRKYAADCNKDGVVTCLDYLKIHYNGRDACQNAELGYVGPRFHACWRGQNLSVLDPGLASYDPRLGFRVQGYPNFTSVYTCSSVPTFAAETPNMVNFVSFAAVSSDLEVEGSFIYRRVQNDVCCYASDARSLGGINLMFVLCDNITDCDLKFRSTANFNSIRSQTYTSIPKYGEFEAGNKSVLRLGLSDAHHGFMECFGAFRNPHSNIDGSFMKKLDYLFTGLDNNKYLISEWYPSSAVISIVKENKPLGEDVRHEFQCKISTFVLLPNVRFGIEFQNGTRMLILATSSNRSAYGQATVQQLAANTDSEMAMTEFQLLITLTQNVKKLLCFAPWINSSRWAESEIPVTIQPRVSSGLTPGAILGYCFAILAIIALIVTLVVWYKYKRAKQRLLTDEEIREFYQGNRNEAKPSDGTVNVENIAFNERMQIPSDCLQTDKEVLGQGEYGIVYKGTYLNHVVAVKMTKPNADINYFIAFLKEIKVMAYMGEHKNIVKFFGAVVDDIKSRICQAVIELSPYGSLHHFLRENSAGFSNLITVKNPDGNTTKIDATYENELKIKFNMLNLVSFCQQIASGMDFMCRKQVIHGDLATRNVLVFENNVVKITDFGLSRKLYGCANYVKKQQAPLPWRWMAIETLRYLSFSTKSDVWAFGITAWEIFTLAQVPFSALSWTVEFADKLEAGLRLQKPNHAPQPIYDIMLRCWENNPDNRPTFASLESFFKTFISQYSRLEAGDSDASTSLSSNVYYLHPLE